MFHFLNCHCSSISLYDYPRLNHFEVHPRPSVRLNVSLFVGAIHSNSTVQPAQAADGFGHSSALTATAFPTRAPHAHDAPKPAFKNKPLGPVQNMLNVPSRPLKTNNRATRPPR